MQCQFTLSKLYCVLCIFFSPHTYEALFCKICIYTVLYNPHRSVALYMSCCSFDSPPQHTTILLPTNPSVVLSHSAVSPNNNDLKWVYHPGEKKKKLKHDTLFRLANSYCRLISQLLYVILFTHVLQLHCIIIMAEITAQYCRLRNIMSTTFTQIL